LAGNWTTHADFIGVRKDGSGEGYCNTNDADAISIFTGGTFDDDQYAQCVLRAGYNQDNATLVLRAEGATGTSKFYAVSISDGNNAVWIYYYDGANFNLIDNLLL
jgi:hypothetical protein